MQAASLFIQMYSIGYGADRAIGQYRYPQLLEVVGAGHAIGGLAHLLHCRQEKTDKDRDDGDYDQQLDERKGPVSAAPTHVQG